MKIAPVTHSKPTLTELLTPPTPTKGGNCTIQKYGDFQLKDRSI